MTTFITPYQPKYRRLNPEVILYRHKPGGEIDGQVDISKYVRSANISNEINNPVGTMNISFVPFVTEQGDVSIQDQLHAIKRYLTIFQIISVKFDRDSPEYNFYGLVDHFYESTTTNNNSTGRSVNANCSMVIPKLLSRDTIPHAPVLQGDKTVERELGAARTQFLTWLRGSNVSENNKQSNAFLNKKPIEAITYILQNAPATRDYEKILRFDKLSKVFLDIYNDHVYSIRTLGSDLLFDPNLSTFSGNIMAYLNACLDRTFYELYFETVTAIEGKKKYPHNRMVIRPLPYSYKNLSQNPVFGLSKNSANYDDNGSPTKINGYGYWDDLTTVLFDSSMRLEDNLGINDYEINNYFVLNYQNSLLLSSSQSSLFGAYYPVLDFYSIKRYGFRPLEASTTAINRNEILENGKLKRKGSSDDMKEHMKMLLEKRNKLVEWYGFPFYESGQVTAIGNSAYKVGRRLRYTNREFYDPLGFFDKSGKVVFDPATGRALSGTEPQRIYTGMDYYITKVEHRFSYPDVYKTTLGLTRGQAITADGNSFPSKFLDVRGRLPEGHALAYYFKTLVKA